MKLLAAVLLCACMSPLVAHAAVERFAVIIGNNRGLGGDENLRYAEADATRVYEVLRDLGGFEPANMVLLRDEDADTAVRSLIAVNDRVRAAVALPDGQAFLFVYFSGHSDADELHLGSTRLPMTQLAQLARGSAANFRLVILDACRSGTLTRLKGGTIKAPFALPDERLPSDGLAFLTASAANEDAQESDELGASFFTHALVSGLLGAADRDGDGEVAIDEAYRYAYDATLRATSRTFSGTQHPSFRYDYRGQGSVVLTRPEAHAEQRAKLSFPGDMSFLVLRDGPAGAVVAELSEHAPRRSLSLRPGRYFIRARAPEVMYEGELTAIAGSASQLELGDLTRIEYARLVRKGQRESSLAQAIELGPSLRSVLPNADRVCLGGFAGYALDFEHFGVRARLGFCNAGFDNHVVSASTNAYDLDVRVHRAWDLSGVTLELGLGGGSSLFSQTFHAARGLAPSRQTIVPFVALGGGGSVEIGHGFYVGLDVAGETHFLQLRHDALSAPQHSVSFAVRTTLGVGKHF